MHALQLLKDDHARVERLFGRMSAAGEISEKRRIFAEIKRELELHTRIEETAFYPEFAKRSETRNLIEESYEDHEEIKGVLHDLDKVRDDDEFLDQLEELMDDVEDHVDEEENELFPKIEQIMSAQELERIGNAMVAVREGNKDRMAA